MNDGFQFIDIIFFAMVAAFLVLRLRSVLGRRTGHERQRPDPFARGPQAPAKDNVVELPDRRRQTGDAVAATYGGPIAAGLTQIQIADPTFSPEGFLEGARAAFGMIVGAYAAGDTEALRPLLEDQVFANFEAAVQARKAAGETLQTELVSIKSADFEEAKVDGRTAVVTVKFVSEQINAVRDANGEVIDGDPTRIAEVIDIWTFSRDTRSRDPNWFLVATRSPED